MHPKFIKAPLLRGFNFGSIFGSGGGVAHGGGHSMQVPQANPAAQVANPNGGVAVPVVPATSGTGGTQEPTAQQKSDSQLDEFASFWKTPLDAEGKPIQPAADPLSQQMFSFDPAKVQEATGKLDFTKGVDPEKVKLALSGDAAAFLDVLNSVGRAGFTAATLNTGNLLNDGFGRHSQRIDQALPTKFRQIQINTGRSENPLLKDPAVAPMLSALKIVASQNNPNASPEEVLEIAEKYFLGVSKKIAGGDPASGPTGTNTNSDDGADWLKYVGMDK